MKRLFLQLIKWYQKNISPNKPAMCRFVPSCSNYALQAIEEYGALEGGLMALWRFLRCNPFCKGGYDPVIPKKEREKQRAEKRFGRKKS